MASGSAKPTASSKYHGSSKITPKDPHKSHIEAGPPRYPPTIDFASEPEANGNHVAEGARARRPGGRLRGSGPWKTSCNEPSHPTKKDNRSLHTSP